MKLSCADPPLHMMIEKRRQPFRDNEMLSSLLNPMRLRRVSSNPLPPLGIKAKKVPEVNDDQPLIFR